YREIDRLRADEEGAVRFTVSPRGNAYLAVKTRAEPPQTSLGLLVKVRPTVSVELSDDTPPRLSPTTVSGVLEPAADGAAVNLQIRGEERWRTVATTTAQPVPPAEEGEEPPAQSRYEVSLLPRRSGRYRVAVPATEGLARGVSETRRVRVEATASG
ncbi:MAG TPA: hypothetical protein VIL49_09555, partial [Capillimicrobium sp.]